jgi:hypothetical protein
MPRKAASPKPVEIDRPRLPIALAVVAVVGVSLTVGAILWGRSDTGAIDVSATIANSQYAADTLEAGGAPVGAPAQEYVDLPNGGLQPQGQNTVPAPPPPEPVPASPATSTEEEGDAIDEGETSEDAEATESAGEATSNTDGAAEENTTDSGGEGQASL